MPMPSQLKSAGSVRIRNNPDLAKKNNSFFFKMLMTLSSLS